MAWMKLDDKFHTSRKLNSIPRRHRFQAAGLWAIAGSWAASQGTDGCVPHYMIDFWRPTPATVAALVDSGLWSETRDGFEFNSWLEYNPSRTQIERERASSAERMRRSRERKSEEAAGESDDSEDVAPQHDEMDEALMHRPVPSRPVPIKDTLIPTPDELFENWWKLYPRKVGRGQAIRAFRTALGKTDCATLTAAVKAFAKLVSDREKHLIPHASTWLNGERWLDDDLQIVTGNSLSAWIDECESNGSTKLIEDRTGLLYQLADLPVEISSPDEARAFHLRSRQEWIRENRDRITEIILKKESD